MSEPSTPPRPPRPWLTGARRLLPAARRWGSRLAVTVGGALLGVALLGRVDAPIGPFDASLAFRPVGGGADLAIPPLGSLAVDAYDGPLRLEIQLRRIDEVRVQSLVSSPAALDRVVDEVSADLRSAVVRLVWTTTGAAVLGAAGAALLLTRRRREPAIAAGLSVVLLAGTAGIGAATWRPEALSQPTYTGLLVNANSLIGSAEDIVARFDAYRASLEDLVGNVTTLYATIAALPAPPSADADSTVLLHVSDLHLNPAGFDLVAQLVDQFEVDGVLDTGDITDWGSEPENQLIGSVGAFGVPYVYIRGNHDSSVTAGLIAAQPGTAVLDGSDVTVGGVRVVGAADPRFTPDKSSGDDGSGSDELLQATGEELADFAASLDPAPAVALVHDPKTAEPLDGVVPLVLAGHTHDRRVTELDEGTVLMVQGSTGGAGLRALEGEYPEPLTCTVLYFDSATGALTAYDEITVGGLGLTEATIERTVVERPGGETAGAAPAGQAPTGQAPTGQAPTGQAPPGPTPAGPTPAEAGPIGPAEAPAPDPGAPPAASPAG
ncbi:metallophosphoesterase [Geodermatophilus sp. YIM 151500]|uniref:metallophosphoesterase n=1 Tax=Geodermatophilus sp. YIM 151500 TaxID=2984531 RepID=UPI0021E3784F|nr:metallophosphoesterase [Geodermatophilus sp. YIM 151500]MCV2490314.1 metallophosphoesterase [Geodermatophilus sp. YIM 151500]